jgi:HEAT repeat protein
LAEGVNFAGTQWIWYSADPTATSPDFPAGICYFRAGVAVPEKPTITSAEILITADNLFTLYLNGKLVGQSAADPNLWRKPKRFDVSGLVSPGDNVVAVEAVNTVPSPAGLLVKFVAQSADGQTQASLVSDGAWKSSEKAEANWQLPGFDDHAWRSAHVVGSHGIRPWGDLNRNLSRAALESPWPADRPVTNWQLVVKALAAHAKAAAPEPSGVVETTPGPDFSWPEAVMFLGDDCSLYRPHGGTASSHDSLPVTIFNIRKSRAFPEHDLPGPLKIGHKLFVLKPARPGTEPRLLLDAGKGAIGTPHSTYDGRSILLTMVRDGDSFFHIYRLPAEGGSPQRLTDGPFHDIDPAELPDGRIVFTSTRIGTFEEYHSPPSRALFVMNADGSDIHPLTHTFIFDNEPQVLADGRIVFIRSDNFFGRGKVETLLHAIHTDGTEGYTEFGLDIGPDYGGRLRAFQCGSPAPLPDGRLAFVSAPGITVGRLGSAQATQQHLRIEAGDVASLPDGRLICTVARMTPYEVTAKQQKRTAYEYSYEKIALLDLQDKLVKQVLLYDSPGMPLHSPAFLGPRPRPPLLPEHVERPQADDPSATGVFFCQNARFTKNNTAGWQHIRAIRVLGGQGLTVRSSHAYIVHAGNQVTELGTVPLAADGSFYVEVPADRAIAFQAVDAEGRSELNEMSWIYVRPGEHRACLGCHQPRQSAPDCITLPGLAMRSDPIKLLGQGRPHRFRGNNAAVTGQMEIQLDRFREVAGLNRHSETADPLATSAQEVALLIGQLGHADAGQKTSAAQRLAIFRDRTAAPALAGRLADDNREVRVAAALALAACGTRQSVPPLVAALENPDPLTAQAAAVALENLTGHAEAFNAFVDPPERTRQARQWQAWFAGTNWEAIEQDLVKQLAVADRDVVRRAAVTLGHIGGDAARAALRDYVAKEGQNNPFPEWKKTHRGDGTRFNSLSEANPRTLQAATRALGYLQDPAAVPLLADALHRNTDPEQSNLFLAEAAAEALGRIATPEAERALVKALSELKDYFYYVGWYGDHSALYACHACPVHYFIAQSLDALGSTRSGSILPDLIRSLPTDPDRALYPFNDDCEAIVGRVIRRNGAQAAVVETCLAVLGDPRGVRNGPIEEAISKTYQAWAGKPDPENRAAQVLSLVCRDRSYEPRIRAALDRYRQQPTGDFVRAFSGSGLPHSLPVKHWVCFFLARTLGNLADPYSVDALIAVLEQVPNEAAAGRPDPREPGVLFLHNDLTPCYRAAAAWALGQIGDRRAVPCLLAVVENLENAPDVRHAAADALRQIDDPASRAAIRKLAADYPDISTRKALLRPGTN